MNVRGLFTSIGAGGSLIAAAVCALAVFGGVLAFRGEHAGTAEANAGEIVVPARSVQVQTKSPGLVGTVLDAARTGRAIIAAARAPASARRPEIRTRPAPPVTSTPPTANPPSITPSPAPGTSGPSPARPTPDVPTPPVPTPPVPAPTSSSGTVERVVEQTRSTVQPVVDAVPPPAKAPVNDVADTVENVAGIVDGVTGALLP